MPTEKSLFARLGSKLIFGSLVGGGAGLVAGATEMAIAGAMTADDPLLGAFALAMYGGALGAVFGTITGFALAVIVLPFSDRPRIVRRLRLLWGLCAALIVAGICMLAFGPPELIPGANETADNVRSDLVWFYVAPSVLAFVAGAALVPLIARDHDAEAPDRSGALRW
ncbi:MAG: hypothetical protein ACRDF9_13530 [Candidatus Limnocylindria bacterium]